MTEELSHTGADRYRMANRCQLDCFRWNQCIDIIAPPIYILRRQRNSDCKQFLTAFHYQNSGAQLHELQTTLSPLTLIERIVGQPRKKHQTQFAPTTCPRSPRLFRRISSQIGYQADLTHADLFQEQLLTSRVLVFVSHLYSKDTKLTVTTVATSRCCQDKHAGADRARAACSDRRPDACPWFRLYRGSGGYKTCTCQASASRCALADPRE